MFVPPLGAGVRGHSVFERKIEAQVRRYLDCHPYTVPAKVWGLIRAEGGEPVDADVAVAAEAGTSTARAGIISDRVPGMRDPLTAGHPLHQQLVEGDDPVSLSGPAEGDWPVLPVGAGEIRRAVLRRWCWLAAPGTDPDRLYAGDAAYDADHSSDELMQRTHDLDLAAFTGLLVDLEALDPALFAAAWRRDVETVERLVRRHHNRLPMFAGLSAIQDLAERVFVALAVFWEWERGVEFLRAAAGPTRRTHLTLGAALSSSTGLTAAFAANSRDGRYLSDAWMQFLALQELVAVGADTHPVTSPWVAYGPGGNLAAVDHHAGLASTAGHASLARAHGVVAPFVRHHPHRQVQEVAPASFVWGWDPLSLAIAIPLQITATLPERPPLRDRHGAEFVLGLYGAIGRLAMMVLGNICPDTAWAALATSMGAPRSGTAGGGADPLDESPLGQPSLDDVVANPEAWHVLKQQDARSWASPREQRSNALGPCAFDNTVRQVKASLDRVIPSEPIRPGYDLGFHPSAWRSRFDARPHLRAAARRVPAGYATRLPRCYTVHSGPVFEFCIDRAAEIRVGYTPDAQDPAWLYAPAATFAAGQFGDCGMAIRSPALAAKADKVVEQAHAGTMPIIVPPSAAILRKRRKRKSTTNRNPRGPR